MKRFREFIRWMIPASLLLALVISIILAFSQDYAPKRAPACFSDINLTTCIYQGGAYYERWIIQEGGKLFGGKEKFRFLIYLVGIIAAFYLFLFVIVSVIGFIFSLSAKKKEDGGEQKSGRVKVVIVSFANTLAIIVLLGFFIGFFEPYASERLLEGCSHLNYKCLIPSYILTNRQMQELSLNMVNTRFFVHGIIMLVIIYLFYDLHGVVKSLWKQGKKKEVIVKEESN